MLTYILRNKYLVPKLREEIETVVDMSTTPVTMNFTALKNLPLLNSVYQENLRLAVATVTTRVVIEDTEFDGYILKKGRLILSPSRSLSMSDVFDAPGHPATEFWAERFLVDEKQKVRLNASWKPFGGGISYCPGRYIAAAEILMSMAILLLKYDMELDEKNGLMNVMSDRMGTGGLRPDRDAYLKVKRRAT